MSYNNDYYTAKPAADIHTAEDSATLYLNLPGVAKENIDVSFENGVVSVKAESGYEEQGNRVYSDFRPRNFERSFRLGEKYDGESISAEYENGVLKLTVGVKEKALPKKIAISA